MITDRREPTNGVPADPRFSLVLLPPPSRLLPSLTTPSSHFPLPPLGQLGHHSLFSASESINLGSEVMGVGTFRVGHAGAAAKHNRENKVKRASCGSDFITSPTWSQTVDVADEVTFAWDSSCLNITSADIYLYAPYLSSPVIQMFQNVDFAKGSYNATLKPKWWNSTSSVDLQLTIVETGAPEFMQEAPPGPIWTAKYDAFNDSSDASDIGTTSSTDTNITQVNNSESASSGGISKGKIAAAVLVPLIVIAIAILAYIKISRKRQASRHKRWSEAMDKRMSVISTDWRSMSVSGAEAAIRASMAGPNRSSVWSGSGNAGVGVVGVPRPSSTYAVERVSAEGDSAPAEMTQIRRTGVGLRGQVLSTAESVGRTSRVSFAADTRFSRASTGDGVGSRGRPSGESRRAGVQSRAFHSAYIPPVPIPSRLSEYVPEIEVNSGSDSEDTTPGLMSPTQRSGPLDLSAAEINARMSGIQDQNEPRPSLDAMMPALAMMRTNNSSHADLLLEREERPPVPPLPLRLETTSPPAVPPPAKSPIMEAMPMPPLSGVSVMSPDEMLRAYAERRREGGGGMTSPPGTPAPGITFPMPVANTASADITSPMATMRTLYSPAGNGSGTAAGSDGATNPFRKSVAPSRRSDDTQYADEDVSH